MKLAAGYVRCSTDMQDGSIEQQKNEITKWANQNSFTIVEWFEDEGKSGTSFDKRPAFRRLLDLVEGKHSFQFVLVYDESRWGRAGDPRESNYWKVHFGRKGVQVRVINSQSKNENDLASCLIETLETAEAGEYSKKLSRATTRGNTANAQNGFSNGGTPPYGYVRHAVNKTTGDFVRVLPTGEHRNEQSEKVVWALGDPEEVAVVKRIYELRLRGYGHVKIADLLNADHTPCPARGRWRNKNQMWSGGTIITIIRNPAYCGDHVYNRHMLSKKRVGEKSILDAVKEATIADESNWVKVPDRIPAIVSKDVWNKANEQIRVTRVQNRFENTSDFLLSGLIRCSKCGFAYQGEKRQSGSSNYVDGGNKNKGKSVCERFSISQPKIEGFIIELLHKQLPKSRIADKLQSLISDYMSKYDGKDHELESLEKQIDSLAQQMENITDAIARGSSIDILLTKLNELDAKKKTLEVRRNRMSNSRLRTMPVYDIAQSAEELIHGFRRGFDKAPIQERKHLVRCFVHSVVVHPDKRKAVITLCKLPRDNPHGRNLIESAVRQESIRPPLHRL